MATETATKPSLTLKQRINAPPSKVYAAFTEPQTIARWFGPEGVQSVHAENDLRVGGRYRIVMRMGSDEHDVSGVYREVVPNERLVFTWAWKTTPERESLVIVSFKPSGGGTMLTLTHEQFADAEARDRHQHGWTGALVKLERLFA